MLTGAGTGPQGRHLEIHLSFFLKGEMITEEEYRACLKGNMAVYDSKQIINLNQDHHPSLKTGERASLYKGRALDIIADQLCGLTPRERGAKR